MGTASKCILCWKVHVGTDTLQLYIIIINQRYSGAVREWNSIVYGNTGNISHAFSFRLMDFGAVLAAASSLRYNYISHVIESFEVTFNTNWRGKINVIHKPNPFLLLISI